MAEQMGEVRIISRKTVCVTGVESIVSFTEKEAVLSTVSGLLAITGEGITVGGFDKASGTVDITGTINAAFYPGQKRDGKSFFSKLFS